MTKILIVEDEPMNRTLLVTILEANGYATIEAENGEDGVQAAKTHQPGLILMDIQMPKLDGVQATRLLKADESTRGIPVVAITAFAMQEDRERIQRGGFDGYVTKPFGIDGLIEVVRKHARE